MLFFNLTFKTFSQELILQLFLSTKIPRASLFNLFFFMKQFLEDQ